MHADPPPAELGASRASVLETLQAVDAPVGGEVLAGRLDLHGTTVRFDLDALLAAGLLERSAEVTRRRGRPRVLYRALPGGPRRALLTVRGPQGAFGCATTARGRGGSSRTGWGSRRSDG